MASSPRLKLLESAFINWRIPGYMGSLAYRIRPAAPFVFERLMDMRLELRTRAGPTLLSRLRDVMGPAEVFGAREYAALALDWRLMRYVLDAGAHVGAFTLWMAEQSAQCLIASLEPNPETRRLLELNVNRGHLGGRVKVYPWALAGTPGRRRIRPTTDSAASALVEESRPGDIEVTTVALADAITATGFPRIDLLKMDIEGAEHEVFDSTAPKVLRHVVACVVECHPAKGSSGDDILRALAAAGFAVRCVEKPLGLQLVIATRHQVPVD